MGKMVILCVFYHYFIFLKVKIKDFPEAHSLDGRIHHQQTSPARNIEGIYVKKKKNDTTQKSESTQRNEEY